MSDTSKNELIVSEEGQGDPQNDSVYDFLYHDVRRVGSFLAQFDDSGHLQQVIQSERAVKGQRRGWQFKLGGSIALVGSANAEGGRTPAEGGAEASERVYDPLWTNARALLDYLSGANLIQYDTRQAAIGQFVLASGSLIVLDLAMMKQAWDISSIRKGILQSVVQSLQGQQPPGNRHQRRAVAMGTNKNSINTEFEMIMALLSMMPHSIQAQMLGNENVIWCTLDEASIVGRSSDLMLKYDTSISGDWYMLGILDAYPNFASTEGLNNAIVDLAGTMVGQIAARLGPVAREWLGRPNGAYGMTPLLIFRKVSS
ncbi:MAG: hypothetical protein AB7E81_24320 [Hyphomicrobiaceae bacterium]